MMRFVGPVYIAGVVLAFAVGLGVACDPSAEPAARLLQDRVDATGLIVRGRLRQADADLPVCQPEYVFDVHEVLKLAPLAATGTPLYFRDRGTAVVPGVVNGVIQSDGDYVVFPEWSVRDRAFLVDTNDVFELVEGAVVSRGTSRAANAQNGRRADDFLKQIRARAGAR